jgi:adenine C2-methylase RlmN of 23S rRNA A2503 and tRNA A37
VFQAEVLRMGVPKFRAKQLWDWIHVKGVVRSREI